LESGAKVLPTLPSNSDLPTSQFRSGSPSRFMISARAIEFISAICTPCGHTSEHTPHPEQ
jgi:hypothetical protein